MVKETVPNGDRSRWRKARRESSSWEGEEEDVGQLVCEKGNWSKVTRQEIMRHPVVVSRQRKPFWDVE